MADPAAAISGNPGTVAAAESCGGWFSNLSPTCIWRSLASWLGSGMIYLAGLFLGVASSFFNWIILNAVVNFDTTIYGNVATGVQAAWTAFRDISNIIIIGIFTFVAIEMILGTSTFGGKKTVAKVLIVAVLINFSLLFSRVIVESANFVARQFHEAVNLQTVDAAGQATNPYGVGLSGRLAQLMGVGGFNQTGEALYKNAELQRSGFIVLAQGVFTAIIFVAAGAVFLYGAFLLAARAILLVFLIMTSSLAFAAYLLPQSMAGGYWSLWWKTLIQNAILGPLLIIMLWATLQVGSGFSQIRGSGKVGGLINNPADASSIGALFAYIIILGMLYLSFRVSSTLATKVAGFNYAAIIPAFGAGALARTVSFAGRNTLGWGASKAADRVQDASRNTNLSIGTRNALDRVAQNLRKGATADFNPLKARIFGQSLGAEIQKTAGLKKLETIAGKNLGGYDGTLKKKAQVITEQAERITPKQVSDKEKATVRDEASKGQAGQAAASASKELHETTARLADMQKAQADATQAFTAKIDDMTKQMDKLKNDAGAGGQDAGTDTKVKELQQSIEREKSQHKAEMKSQADRIEHAREMMKKAKESHQKAEKAFDEVLNEKIANRLSPNETGTALAHNRYSNTLARITGLSTKENDPLVKAVREVSKLAKEQQKSTKAANDHDRSMHERLLKVERRTETVENLKRTAIDAAKDTPPTRLDSTDA